VPHAAFEELNVQGVDDAKACRGQTLILVDEGVLEEILEVLRRCGASEAKLRFDSILSPATAWEKRRAQDVSVFVL
jgi:hypothetical protein